MLEDLNEWRLDMEDDGESDGEFSGDLSHDFTDLEGGSNTRTRNSFHAEEEGGTDDDDGSESEFDNVDNEDNKDREEWQPEPSIEHQLFFNKRKDFLARCSVAIPKGSDDEIKYNSDTVIVDSHEDGDFDKLKAAAEEIIGVGRFPLERLNHGKAIATDSDVLRAILYMLKGYQSDLFRLRRENPPLAQREFTLTSTALSISTARLSAGVLEKLMRWFVGLGSKMMSCRVYAKTALTQRDIPEQRRRMKTCNYTMLLEALGSFLTDLVVSFDRKIESVEKAMNSKVRPPTLLSLHIYTKSWLNFFIYVDNIASKLFMAQPPKYFPLKLPSKEYLLLSDASFAAVMKELEDLMEAARMVGMDGCTADLADPIVEDWCQAHKISSDEACPQASENHNKSSSPPSFLKKDQSEKIKLFDSLTGPDCFHNLLRELSVIEVAVDSLVPSFNPDPSPSSSDSTSQGNHHRLKLKLTSTLRRNTLLPIVCTHLYRLFTSTYLTELIDWIFAGGPRDDGDILDALETCMTEAQGGDAGLDRRKHAKCILTNLFAEIPQVFHDIACEAMCLSSDIILIKCTDSTKTSDAIDLINSIKNGMQEFDDVFAQHPSNHVIDESNKKRGDSGYNNLPPAPSSGPEDTATKVKLMHEEKTRVSFPLSIMSNNWIGSTYLYDDSVATNNTINDEDSKTIADGNPKKEDDEKSSYKKIVTDDSGSAFSTDSNDSIPDINMVQVFSNAFKPSSMKIQDSIVASVRNSLNLLSKTSSDLLRTDHALIEHLKFLQTVFTLQQPVCYDPLRWSVLFLQSCYVCLNIF